MAIIRMQQQSSKLSMSKSFRKGFPAVIGGCTSCPPCVRTAWQMMEMWDVQMSQPSLDLHKIRFSASNLTGTAINCFLQSSPLALLGRSQWPWLGYPWYWLQRQPIISLPPYLYPMKGLYCMILTVNSAALEGLDLLKLWKRPGLRSSRLSTTRS